MGSGAEIFNQVINQGGSPALLTNTLALRPSFGYTGRIFIASDTREIYRDTGTSWELIGSGGGSVNIYNSDGTLTGARSVTLGGNNLTFIGTGAIKIFSTTVESFVNTSSAALGRSPVIGVSYAVVYNSNSSGYVGFQQRDGTSSRYGISGLSEIISANTNGLGIIYAGNLIFGNSSTEFGRFTSTGRLLLGTTTDAGHILDVNNTSIFRNSVNTVNADILVQTTNRGLACGSNSITVQFVGARDATAFSWVVNNQYNQANTNRSYFGFSGVVIGHNSGTNANTIINLNPTINTVGGTNVIYGYRYNPNIISGTGIDLHYAYQSTQGRIEGINADTPNNIYAFAAARFLQTHNITAGQSVNGGTYYSAGANVSTLNLAGSATFGIGNVWAAGYNQNYFQFQAPGSTITVTQTALRTVAALTAFNQFGGSNSGTITHCTGLNVLGFYNDNNSVITPVITNAYGIVINNLNNYSHNFTLTNRWGLYQDGSLDNNYLAGKLLVGTNTVTARQVHIAGDVEYTTTLSGTSGGSSGQHLNVWVNGTQYKIDLKNP